jgi:hypothetical protein
MGVRSVVGQCLWAFGLSAIVLLLLFTPSAIVDLLRAQPIGTTISGDLRNPSLSDPVAMTFSAYAFVVVVGSLVYNSRRQRKHDS